MDAWPDPPCAMGPAFPTPSGKAESLASSPVPVTAFSADPLPSHSAAMSLSAAAYAAGLWPFEASRSYASLAAPSDTSASWAESAEGRRGGVGRGGRGLKERGPSGKEGGMLSDRLQLRNLEDSE